jgi:hypothetical protein
MFFGLALNSQQDFFKTYKTISTIYERHRSSVPAATITVGDSIQLKKLIRATSTFFADSIIPHTKKVLSSTFPDVTFTDVNGKSWAVSDFSGKEVIVNYNYLYCRSCIDRIDSTEKLIAGKKVQMIVLFLDVYEKEISDLRDYGESVKIGFINPDNADLISLKQGDNCMYYLNKARQIEFYDKLYDNYDTEWTRFLKAHLR